MVECIQLLHGGVSILLHGGVFILLHGAVFILLHDSKCPYCYMIKSVRTAT